MTCMEAQSSITAFINDEMDIAELEEFIEHIQDCEECMDELDVYYALLTAMKQLDEDRNLSDDFSQELREKIDCSQERIIHLRYNYYRKKRRIDDDFVPLNGVFSFYHYFISTEEKNTVTRSQFRLRTSFMEERFDKRERSLTDI